MSKKTKEFEKYFAHPYTFCEKAVSFPSWYPVKDTEIKPELSGYDTNKNTVFTFIDTGSKYTLKYSNPATQATPVTQQQPTTQPATQPATQTATSR